jgi:hypothetical protein
MRIGDRLGDGRKYTGRHQAAVDEAVNDLAQALFDALGFKDEPAPPKVKSVRDRLKEAVKEHGAKSWL